MHLVEQTCDRMGDRRLSRACLAEKDETTFRGGVVHPIDNEVQECHACSQKTALVGTESRAESVWDFSDFRIEFYCITTIGSVTRKPSKITYQRLKPESGFCPSRSEF